MIGRLSTSPRDSLLDFSLVYPKPCSLGMRRTVTPAGGVCPTEEAGDKVSLGSPEGREDFSSCNLVSS